MEANKILSSDILDLVFENRNKAYGAYELRKTYNKRITAALLITAGIAVLIFLASFIANTIKSKEAKLDIDSTSGSLPFKDDTTHIVLSPLEFMQHLAVMVPRSRPSKRLWSSEIRGGGYLRPSGDRASPRRFN